MSWALSELHKVRKTSVCTGAKPRKAPAPYVRACASNKWITTWMVFQL